MFPITSIPRAGWWALTGLLVGIVGLVVQTIAEPAKFAAAERSFGVPFPPGILFILGAAVLMLATCRWRWHPVFAVLIGLQIVVGGVLAGVLLPNLVSPVIGTVVGNAVMTVGLVAAIVAGVVAIAAPHRR